jgi:ElaB/YqjD/DUF883 family membrane-anchored ribosome-binding protein
MGVIEKGIYVWVGAVDLAAEKVREIPAVEKIREASVFDQVKEFEPKLRKQANDLQARGEKALKDARARAEKRRNAVRARIRGFGRDAREQLADLRGRVVRTGRPAVKASGARTASKTNAKVPTGA